MKVGLALVLSVLSAILLVAIPSVVMANEDLDNDNNPNYIIHEPSWNVGDIVKNYPNYIIHEPSWNVGDIVKNYPNSTNVPDKGTIIICTPGWINAGCEVWSECSDGVRRRVCEIFNPCDGSLNKTTETRSCIVENVSVFPTTNTTTSIQNQSHANISAAQNLTTNQSAHNVSTPGYTNATNATSGILNNTTNQGSNPAISINITVPSVGPKEETAGGSEASTRTPEPARPALTVPNVTRVYDIIEANASAVVPIENPDVSVRQITVEVINRTTDVQITVAQLLEKPAEVKTEAVTKPSQRVYNYIEVSHENLTNANIRNASISFEVSKSWIRQNRINASTIRLSRYENPWTELKTKVVNESEDSVQYEAESIGLSIFAIVGEQMLQYSGSACVPLDRRCSGSTLEECSMDSSGWSKVKDCEFSCRVERCLNATEAKEGSQEERNLFGYAAIIIIIVALIAVLGMIASYFRNKARVKMLEIERDMIRQLTEL